MADYTAYTWVEKVTKVGPTRMNALEAGVADAATHHRSGTFSAMPPASPANKNWLYFATDIGILFANYDGAHWTPITPGFEHDALQAGVLNGSGDGGGGDLAWTAGAWNGVAFQDHVAAGTIYIPSSVGGPTVRHVLPAQVTLASRPTLAGAAGTTQMMRLYAQYVGPNQAPNLQWVAGSSFATPGSNNDLDHVATGNLPAAPAGAPSVILEDLLVNSNSGQGAIVQSRDRRPWSRGAHRYKSTTTAFTCTSSAWTPITGVGPIRLECSGVPIKLRLGMSSWFTGSVGSFPYFMVLVDNAEPPLARKGQVNMPGANYREAPALDWQYTPSAGTHLFQPVMATVSGNSHTIGDNPSPAGVGGIDFTVWEELRQDASNGSA